MLQDHMPETVLSALEKVSLAAVVVVVDLNATFMFTKHFSPFFIYDFIVQT